ncbi:NCS2 family permease [uncultured Flavonifractor sp.]|uniref:NCS2 family permease n=1 Tax=uncultured Flavonifractor sp. TaxID=1193534 RepID=UPI002612F720|nr:NCS2 family permease [uncultured Flavonifractor sp.]
MTEKLFHLTEKGANVRTELLAGLTTFMTMAYILMVNAGMFAELPGVSYYAIYVATALSAAIGTILIGLLANLPLAQASAMGSNAFFVYTVCMGFGLSYANALVLILLDGIAFVLLTVTGLRKKIFEAIPAPVRLTIPAGVGLFIAFIGLQSAGIVVADSETFVTLASFNLLFGSAAWADVMPILVTLAALTAIAVMTCRGTKGAVLWGILGGTVLYYLLGFTVPEFYGNFGASLNLNPFAAFQEFGASAFGRVFTEGFDFSHYLADHNHAQLALLIATTALAFCLVDMFDTIGTLYGACARGNLLTKEGEVPNMERAMLADAVATVCGAVCGTSTVSSYVEASAGIAEGGKTGLASMATGGLFLVAMFFSPVASLVPGCATSAALIYVGILMMDCTKRINWQNTEEAVPAFLTLAIMPMTYNISYGIAFGVISHVLIQVFAGKGKQVNGGTWVIAGLFTLMFLVTH